MALQVPVPWNESARLSRIDELRAVVKGDSVLDRLVRIAAAAVGMPLSLVTLVERDQQRCVAQAGGAPIPNLPREIALCAHAILSPGAALENEGWHRVFVQGGSAEPHADGTFGMTELRHEVAPNDHFLVSAGAFVEWTYPVRNTLVGNLFAHMARTNDPDSATAQFFINQRSNLQLDWAPGRMGYTVFGEVVDGMQAVDFIASAETGKVGSFSDVPLQPIMILEIVRQSSP